MAELDSGTVCSPHAMMMRMMIVTLMKLIYAFKSMTVRMYVVDAIYFCDIFLCYISVIYFLNILAAIYSSQSQWASRLCLIHSDISIINKHTQYLSHG